MKNQTFYIIGLIVLLLALLAFVEWGKFKSEESVYGMKLSFDNDLQRSFTWLSASSYENSILQIKPEEASWQGGEVKEIPAMQSYLQNKDGVLFTYRAQIDGLAWGQNYTYRVVANNKVISDEYTFSVAQQNQNTFQFIHVTDTQGTSAEHFKQWGNTLQQALKLAPEAQFIVHGGDITDDPSKLQQWQWFYENADVFSKLPLLITFGNHEIVDNKPDYYQAHVTFPSNGTQGLPAYTSYYALYQNTLFISLNTEADISAQSMWLRNVLEQHAEQVTWIIASMHRGLYGASKFKDAKEWGELFDQFNVDLVLQGHNHSYSRSYPLMDGEAVKDKEQGTVYITMNAAGSKLNEEKKEKSYQAVAFQNGKSMFGIVNVEPTRLTYTAYDVDGKLLDQVILSKND